MAQDPFFAWLQPMTRLIVEIEEGDVRNARSRIDALLTGGKGDFSVRFLELLQESPEVAAANGALQKVLREGTPT